MIPRRSRRSRDFVHPLMRNLTVHTGVISTQSRVSDEWQWSLTDPDKGVVEVAAVLSVQDAVHVAVGKTRIDGRDDGGVLVEGQYFRANGAVPGGIRSPQRPTRVHGAGFPDLRSADRSRAHAGRAEQFDRMRGVAADLFWSVLID